MNLEKLSKNRIIFDPIYGFIKLSPVEWEIIHTPFYQRLRWIKQIGFSFYTFPGAEHSRFGHSIGVMFNAHKILESCGLGVKEKHLMDSSSMYEEAQFHKSLRISALLHDLGTFPFSHTTEAAYIDFGETSQKIKDKSRQDNHEHLGSYIIKNSDYDNGITKILLKYGFDPQVISNQVKGIGESILANQILHSEIDCDRMDYLLRDAHYTGLKYGAYDRDYLLYHFNVMNVGGHRVLAIKQNALHCVEDFLTARFAWYSQVVRSARGAKYDSIAEHVTKFLLEKGFIYRYSDLLSMVDDDPVKFFSFNDAYFINTIQELYSQGKLNKYPKIEDMVKSLLFEISPKTIRCNEFKQVLLSQDSPDDETKLLKKIYEKKEEIEITLEKYGKESDWVIIDIPKKKIIFTKSYNQIIKNKSQSNIFLERDPVKICNENDEIQLLSQHDSSVISKMGNIYNFIPNVFCSFSAYNLLIEKGVIPQS